MIVIEYPHILLTYIISDEKQDLDFKDIIQITG